MNSNRRASQQESIVSHLNRQGVITEVALSKAIKNERKQWGPTKAKGAGLRFGRLGVFVLPPAAAVDMIAGLTELKRHGFQVANQDSVRKDILPGRP